METKTGNGQQLGCAAGFNPPFLPVTNPTSSHSSGPTVRIRTRLIDTYQPHLQATLHFSSAFRLD